MALKVQSLGAQADADRASSAMKADRPLWLNAAKDQVVEDGAVEAAFLFAPQGEPIQPAHANRYGLRLVDGIVVLPTAAAVAPVVEAPPAPKPEAPPPVQPEAPPAA